MNIELTTLEEAVLLWKKRSKAWDLLTEKNMSTVVSVNELIYKLVHPIVGFGDLWQVRFHPELPNKLDELI